MSDKYKDLMNSYRKAGSKVVDINLDEFYRGGEYDPTDLGKSLLAKAFMEIDKEFLMDALSNAMEIDKEIEKTMTKFVNKEFKTIDDLITAGELWKHLAEAVQEHAMTMADHVDLGDYAAYEGVRAAEERGRQTRDAFQPNGEDARF